MIYKGDVSHLGHLTSKFDSQTAKHQIQKYLTKEIFKKHKFILRKEYRNFPPLTMFNVKNWYNEENKIWLIAKSNSNIWSHILTNYFYKPLIGGRTGYHPETKEQNLIFDLTNQFIKLRDNSISNILHIYIGNNHNLEIPVAHINKVVEKGRRPKADISLGVSIPLFWISHKNHRFPSWGGISKLKNHTVIKEFKEKLAKYVSFKKGVGSGSGYAMNLDPKKYYHEVVIRRVMFGDRYNHYEYGPNNCNAIIYGNMNLKKHHSHYHLNADKIIWNDSSFKLSDYPVQLVAHKMHDRNDLGFKETHVMMVPAGSRPRCILI